MSEIFRQNFLALARDNKYRNHYIILLDGVQNDELWADNDDDAIEQFKAMF